jgi:hypothetical protein
MIEPAGEIPQLLFPGIHPAILGRAELVSNANVRFTETLPRQLKPAISPEHRRHAEPAAILLPSPPFRRLDVNRIVPAPSDIASGASVCRKSEAAKPCGPGRSGLENAKAG